MTKNIFAHSQPLEEGGPVAAYLFLSKEAVEIFQVCIFLSFSF